LREKKGIIMLIWVAYKLYIILAHVMSTPSSWIIILSSLSIYGVAATNYKEREGERERAKETEQPTNPEQGFGEKKGGLPNSPLFCRTFLAPELGKSQLPRSVPPTTSEFVGLFLSRSRMNADVERSDVGDDGGE
jgi:hypothetical protein